MTSLFEAKARSQWWKLAVMTEELLILVCPSSRSFCDRFAQADQEGAISATPLWPVSA
jgi:hypothetical protein